jgi:hypothetical protein
VFGRSFGGGVFGRSFGLAGRADGGRSLLLGLLNRSLLGGRLGCTFGGVFGRSFGLAGRADGGRSMRSLFGCAFGGVMFGRSAVNGRFG